MDRNPAQQNHWLIVGAGIGGLTLAAALRQRGQRFTVFEQQTAPTTVGAGIALAPNAMNALATLGIAEDVARRGQPMSTSKLLGSRGYTELKSIDLSFVQKDHGVLPVAIHRSQLLASLLNACGIENVRYGWRCNGVTQSEQAVSVSFENGMQSNGTALIGADGIHSVVAKSVFAPQALNYRGFVAWRGICTPDAELTPPATNMQIWGPGSVFGIAPIGANNIYWYGTRLIDAEYARSATKQDALEYFAQWAEPIPAVIKATEQQAVLCHAIYDHDALPEWFKGRVAVLGDAAHAMPPNMGQGGAQSILDAIALADSLASTHDLQSAWSDFGEKRKKPADDMVVKSRQAAKLDHLRSPILSCGRDLLVRATPQSVMQTLLRPDSKR